MRTKWKWLVAMGLMLVLTGGGSYLYYLARANFARGFEIGYDSGHSNANEEMANENYKEGD